MAITTSIPALCLSAALPDVIDITSTYSIIAAKVKVGNTVIWSTELYTYQGATQLYDIRNVIETYLRANSLAIGVCDIVITENSTDTANGAFIVIMSDIDIPSAATWLQSHFLTTQEVQLIPRSGQQKLYWYAAQGENITYEITARKKVQSGINTETWQQSVSANVNQGIYSYLVDVATLETHFQNELQSFTVKRGTNRTMTFYVIDDTPSLVLSFLNNFNVEEFAHLFIEVNKKSSLDASEAKSLRTSIRYDFHQNEEFEVETSILPIDTARWLAQMISSRYVAKKMPGGSYREIIIDGTSEVKNSPNAENRLKFSYKYAQEIKSLE